MKVIVCGVRFGQFYIEAIRRCKGLELAGIMSAGSKASQACAARYGVELYTDVKELPEDIEIACVVVRTETQGGAGTELAKQLMECGIPVMLEQPAHKKELLELYKTAVKNKTVFTVGNHYMQLKSVEAFIRYAKSLMEKQKPIYINIDLSTQVAYPCAQVLAELFEGKLTIKEVGRLVPDVPFSSALMLVNEIPVNVRAQNQMAADVSDNYTHLFFQISIGFAGGMLTLQDVHGAVTYRERMTVPELEFMPGDLKTVCVGQLCEESIRNLYTGEQQNYKEILDSVWPEAIKEQLQQMVEMISGVISTKEWNRRSTVSLTAAGAWSDIMGILGFPYVCDALQREWIDMDEILSNEYQSLSMQQRYDRITKREVEYGTAMLNRACMIGMLKIFQAHGMFQTVGQWHQVGEVLEKVPHQSAFTYILRRWLLVMEQSGILLREQERFALSEHLDADQVFEPVWKKAGNLWNHRMGPQSVYEYFYENARQLPKLLNGRRTAQEMLFLEGQTDIASDLYRRTLIAWAMNQKIASVTAQYAAEREKITILEVGAGTGATTEVVLGKIKDEGLCKAIERYNFTDLSRFFLEDAKKAYGNYAFFSTAQLDIEAESVGEERYDILIGAGVLNNVDDTTAVLEKLRRRLKKGGILVISEAVGESIPMLISQIFMMHEASDARAKTSTTFLSQEQWKETWENARLRCVEEFPAKNHKLEALGQRVFVLKVEEGWNEK